MKYLLFVSVLLGAICVIDYCMPDAPAQMACQAVTPKAPAMPTVASQPSLRDTCETAPLIVDENLDRIQAAPVRMRWFPGKNILRAIRHIHHR